MNFFPVDLESRSDGRSDFAFGLSTCAVLSLVIGLTTALAVLADLGGHWCRSRRLAALALLVVP